jgi:hypothetical protein
MSEESGFSWERAEAGITANRTRTAMSQVERVTVASLFRNGRFQIDTDL